LLAGLGDRPGRLYRIDFRLERPNRRLALAADDVLDAGALASISARLQRFDRLSGWGPWTSAVLALVDRRPGQPAGELAAEAGMHKRLFKRRVRSLREMGLTESLETGYRLSPRGRRYLDKVASRSARPAATGKPDQ
jgi:hypothetical protein